MVAYGVIAAYIALACGLFFFFGYAVRYYLYVAVILFLSLFGRNGSRTQPTTQESLKSGLTAEPLVSIHLPVFNEPNVVERLLACCTSLDYRNYEVILLDDSVDNTVDRLKEWAEANQVAYSTRVGKQGEEVHVTNTIASLQIPIKVIHRTKRTGFKGGALNEALNYMNPDAEYVMIFDADFIPPPDIIKLSLPYFSLPSPAELLREIAKLDEGYASQKLDMDTYLKERERLATKLRGNTAITEGARAAMKAVFTLDQLYADGKITRYEYKIRRKAIADEMSKIPIVAATASDEPLALHRAFTVGQLLAENKIRAHEYATRIRAIFAPFAEKPRPTNTYDDTVLKITQLDADYAGGKITEEEYASKRKELKAKLDVAEPKPSAPSPANDLNNAPANKDISLEDYRKTQTDTHATNKTNDKKSSGRLHFLRILKSNGNRNGKQGKNGNGNGNGKGNGNGNGKQNGNGYEYVAVQGYQLHSLNQDENWLTAGVRAEFSGSYMIERPAQEFFGSMKMISGSVYMIRADVLRKYRWSDSITEDWELTNRLYLDGKRVAYTPTIEAPAEAPATLRRLLRQRQRWAEGHSFNVKKYFLRFMTSPNTTLTEKLEYLYYTTYYIQGLFFIIGTIAWMIQLYTRAAIPGWTSLFGWGLLLSNTFAIPLMNFSGLIGEGPGRRDIKGVFSAIALTYVVAFFQGYAALKGFLEPKEGGWIRTFKSGKVTQPPFEVKPRVHVPLHPLAPRAPGRAPRRAALGSLLRQTPTVTVIVLLLAGLMAGTLFLSTSVQSVQALPANMAWYPTVAQSLQTAPTGISAEVTLSNNPHLWSTPTQYSVGQSDAVGGWVFHLVCAFATQIKGYNVTVNVYYSATPGRGQLLQSGTASLNSLTCDSTNENLVSLKPVPWTGPAGTYHLNLEVLTSNPAAFVSITIGGPNGSSITDGNSVPEYVLPLIGLVPLIPITMKRMRKK